ncbi:class I SAM-dependent methyltransferase [Oceanomicrobium pacificus]|uniref:Methyltransferase n=1 Tax=Oceanomicrobium pacificus TaxID=2692916 RepID=A0A6B0TXC5_9RHOB|nr:class I SAM-dependent methyltransferase [Oceanomicrobium pacificus]MXU65804.1 methyltransferase [Oceanomicrobium pacificus]
MDRVETQYELYPYPERDPEDERRRLITGSPSDPVEVDHFLFGGHGDWRTDRRILVAGGGTGDGLIQLAQKMADTGRMPRITYLDMSRAARRIAEARAEIRGLSDHIDFVTGSLLDAPEMGPFDYIDCTGVLHHLPDPDAGFRALARALTPDGGIGMMVYAPYGRSGVYEMQPFFNRLLQDFPEEEKVGAARRILRNLPPHNRFRMNSLLVDHKQSDAGLYDLLLHARDRPYTVPDLLAAVDQADLQLVSFTQPAKYSLEPLLPEEKNLAEAREGLSVAEEWTLAEQLRGDLKTHVAYLAPKGRTAPMADIGDPALRPRLKGMRAEALAREIQTKGRLRITDESGKQVLVIPKETAPLIALADGRLTLGQMAQAAGQDWFAFSALWRKVHGPLHGWGLIHYSDTFR